jgi:hypothetical protein
MLSYLVLSMAVLLPFASANYGAIGSCPAERINGFIGALPNGDACGGAYLTLLNPTAVSEDNYNAALTLFCSSDCGQKITKFSATECGSAGLDAAFGFLFYCLPREDGPSASDRCRSVFPDLVNETLVASLGACLPFNGDGCPAGCEAAMNAAIAAFGCCYQIVYNNTGLVTALAEFNLLTANDLAIINITKYPALWQACGIPLLAPCDGDPFAGTPTVPFGVCSFSQLTTFVSDSTDASCVDAYTTLHFTEGATNDQMNTALNNKCQNDCAGRVAGFLRDTCQDTFTSALTTVTCAETDGSIGDRCTNIGDVNNAVYERVGAACFVPGDCPAGCADALQGLKNTLGCCYQSFFNDTRILNFLFFNFTITYEDVSFFKAVGYPGIWNACGVSLQEPCSTPFVEPPTAGAVKFAASFVVMSLIIFALIL